MSFKSNQPLVEDRVEEIGELATHEPQVYEQLAMRRSITYKDPSKPKQPNMQLWNLINQMPTYAINQVVRPKILQNDQSKKTAVFHD